MDDLPQQSLSQYWLADDHPYLKNAMKDIAALRHNVTTQPLQDRLSGEQWKKCFAKHRIVRAAIANTFKCKAVPSNLRVWLSLSVSGMIYDTRLNLCNVRFKTYID